MGRRHDKQRGSTAIEFALVMICLIPLFFGTIVMGITIGRSEEAIQVTRDVGHMYAEGLDFTTADAQQLVTQIAQGFNVTATGNTLLIFSQISTVFQADCTAASVRTCSNLGSGVLVQRVTIGDTALNISSFGTPPAADLDSEGNIAAANYLTLSSCIATGFTSILTQNDGDVAYVVEGYFSMPDLSFLTPGFPGKSATGGLYARAIF
jgi:hypothetical protein